MAKHLAFLHLGHRLRDVADLHAVLQADASLAAAGLVVPGVTSEQMAHADLEIRRRHTEAGLTRKVVEGAWAGVCRKLYKAKSDVVVTQPDFLLAPAAQAALAMDGLFGFKVHVVLTPEVEPLDPTELLGPWAGLVKPEHVHVVTARGGVLTPEELTGELVTIAARVRTERQARRLLKRARKADKDRTAAA